MNDIEDARTTAHPCELVSTHPIIRLDAEGLLEQVARHENKRAVSAIPYSTYEPFMDAYKLWMKLIEEERFIKRFDWPEGSVVALNNWRLLHGRGTLKPNMDRTCVFAHVSKGNFENRYRLLKHNQTERANPQLNNQWLTRLPNQVLAKLVSN
eukprot:SAG11_NODE_253_length_11591_cov_15.933693_15_plen_153_part_00